MSKVDRSHRSLTSKTATRKVLKVNSDSAERPKAAVSEDGPFPWEEQARPSGSDPAQNADFIVEVSWVFSHTCPRHAALISARIEQSHVLLPKCSLQFSFEHQALL